VLAGQWTLGEELRVGGVSKTYRATDASGDAFVVRVFDAQLAERAEAMASQRRAAERTNRLPEAMTAHVVDSGIDPQTRAPYIVVPFLKTSSLAGGDKRSPEAVHALLVAMARVLDAMHAMRGAHLGLKPSNVFVGATPEEVRVVDFGMAHARAALITPEGRAISAPWIAPEQLRAEDDAGAPSDVFSAALVAFFALTGKSLWTACDAKTLDVDAVAKELKGKAPKPSMRAKAIGVPFVEILDGVLLRALSEKPADRFASVGAFAAAFGEALRAKPHATEILIAIPAPKAPARPSKPSAPSRPEPIDVTADAIKEPSIAEPLEFLPLLDLSKPPPPPKPAMEAPVAAASEASASKVPPPVVDSIALASDDDASRVGDKGLFAPPPLLVRLKGHAREGAKIAAAKSAQLYERARELQRVNPRAAIVGGVLGAAVLLLIVGGIVAMCSKPKHSSDEASTVPTSRSTTASNATATANANASSSATSEPTLPTTVAGLTTTTPPIAAATSTSTGGTTDSTQGTITLQCNPVPCTWVRIDGKSQTNAAGPFGVAPGKHVLTAGAMGYQSATDNADVSAGTTTDKTLTLALAPASTTKKPATTTKKDCSKFFHTCK
jgi:serine/threonine protein kinase